MIIQINTGLLRLILDYSDWLSPEGIARASLALPHDLSIRYKQREETTWIFFFSIIVVGTMKNEVDLDYSKKEQLNENRYPRNLDEPRMESGSTQNGHRRNEQYPE